ncbi:MAG: hypothetical protein ACE5HV_16430 [Acidobacteriota bacterium]
MIAEVSDRALEEARERVNDAICAYLESLRKDGLAIPREERAFPDPVKEQIRVTLETA